MRLQSSATSTDFIVGYRRSTRYYGPLSDLVRPKAWSNVRLTYLNLWVSAFQFRAFGPRILIDTGLL